MMRSENPSASLSLLLDVASKAYNDTSGINGLVPTVLVYGTWPKLPIRDDAYHSASHSERAKLRLTAMEEYQKYEADTRAQSTEQCQAPMVPSDLRPGDFLFDLETSPEAMDRSAQSRIGCS